LQGSVSTRSCLTSVELSKALGLRLPYPLESCSWVRCIGQGLERTSSLLSMILQQSSNFLVGSSSQVWWANPCAGASSSGTAGLGGRFDQLSAASGRGSDLRSNGHHSVGDFRRARTGYELQEYVLVWSRCWRRELDSDGRLGKAADCEE
jgi:hypothetical protein